MKINDLLNEGYYDNEPSNATGQKYFVDSFTKQLNAFIDSSRKSGQPVKVWDFVSSYLTKYGWTASTEQTSMLKDLASDVEAEYNILQKKQEPKQPASDAGSKAFGQMANQLSTTKKDWSPSPDSPAVWKSNRTGQPMNEGLGDYMIHKAGNLMSKLGMGSVVKLANAVYTVGMTQHRDPRTGRVMNTGAMGTAAQDDSTIDPAGKQIIDKLKTLKGPQYEKDLEEIVKLALWNLHGTDKQDYSTFVQNIFNKRGSTQNPMQNQQQPT